MTTQNPGQQFTGPIGPSGPFGPSGPSGPSYITIKQWIKQVNINSVNNIIRIIIIL